MELNDQQQQVVRDLSQPILLNAPAGTGKTRVLACRVAHILETKAAEGAQILCLTFTNRACKELKERIVATAHEKGLDVVVKTIHSFCYSLIKEETKRQSDCYNDFLLYDDEDCRQLIDNLPAARRHRAMTPRPCRTISNLPRNSASSRTSTISRHRKNPSRPGSMTTATTSSGNTMPS